MSVVGLFTSVVSKLNGTGCRLVLFMYESHLIYSKRTAAKTGSGPLESHRGPQFLCPCWYTRILPHA